MVRTPTDRTSAALLGAVFFIATAGLVYELVAGTAATYLLGNSVTQFSLVIGVYLFAMGVGSYLSRYIHTDLLSWFVRLELLVGILGGFSAVALMWTFSREGSFRVVLFLLVFGVGAGVGLEIPLLIRILKDRMKLEDLIARVLFFDYLGALAASLLFPLLLVPKLGLIKTSLLLGMLNVLVGLWVALLFQRLLPRPRRLIIESLLALILMATGLVYGERMTRMVEDDLFPHEIVHAESSRYQRLIVTRSKRGETRLYLNGHLQFSSADEYRYHESLVHPPMALAKTGPLEVLVLGGGDGMATRELLRYPDVSQITLVDLDPAMTRLFSHKALLTGLNKKSLTDPRTKVINADALSWLEDHPKRRFDVIIIDFPDPTSYAVGKLYTLTFYRWVKAALNPAGVLVVQSTSPLAARGAFWCIDQTLREAGLYTRPYHVLVPSFGEWGYVIAAPSPIPIPNQLRHGLAGGLRFLDDDSLAALFSFPKDMARPAHNPVNRLNNPHLVRLYDEEWSILQDDWH